MSLVLRDSGLTWNIDLVIFGYSLYLPYLEWPNLFCTIFSQVIPLEYPPNFTKKGSNVVIAD